jgi:hypothetical protein
MEVLISGESASGEVEDAVCQKADAERSLKDCRVQVFSTTTSFWAYIDPVKVPESGGEQYRYRTYCCSRELPYSGVLRAFSNRRCGSI